MSRDYRNDDIVESHVERRMIIDYSVVPDHISRDNPKEENDFEQAKQQMKKDGNNRCFVCGCESTPENRIEYHHFLVESCFNNVADMNKLWELAKLIDIYGYGKKATKPPKTCNTPMNLIPLCHNHHVESGGIHNNSFSTFIIQRLVKDNLSDEEQPVPQDMNELERLKEEYENKIKKNKGYNE